MDLEGTPSGVVAKHLEHMELRLSAVEVYLLEHIRRGLKQTGAG